MSDQFKISMFAMGAPQMIRLCYSVNQFRESDKFPGSYSTQIEHGGVKKYWNMSGMVVDAISQLGVEAGDTIVVTRKEGKKGSFTEVSLPNDITTAPQNRSKAPQARPSGEDTREVPLESFSDSNRNVSDPTQDRIIFGMSGNQAAALMSGTIEGMQAAHVVETWEVLRDMIYQSNKKGPPKPASEEVMDAHGLPF